MIMLKNRIFADVKPLLAGTHFPTLLFCIFALPGCVSIGGGPVIIELRKADIHRPLVHYASSIANDTLTVAAAFEKIDSRLPVYVTGQNSMGDACTEAKFNGREIIGLELSKAVNSNFRRVAPGELPLLMVKIALSRASMSRKSAGVVHVAIRGNVVVRNFEKTDDVCYDKDISIEKDGPAAELNEGIVPQVFYEAAEAFAKEFVCLWSVDGVAQLKLDSWRRKCDHGVINAPELENGIRWCEDLCKNDLVVGECVVIRNDYDYARATTWAKAHIASVCREKLGVELSRLRIVHDEEKHDPKSKKITLRFHAFPRVPYVYQYWNINEHGFITGDLVLMGMDFGAAKEKLKAIVKSELEKGRQRVEFGDVVPDKTFNLLTYNFTVKHY